MKGNKINIIKASGHQDVFDEDKLKRSLEHTGASEFIIKDIITEIKASLFDGMTTKEIYKKAFELLKLNSRPTAARYKLKNAIMELGPTGFPFEKFIGEILRKEGFKVSIGVFMEGKCVRHEIDVLAEKDNQYFMIECKYHNELGTISNVKTPLYIQSRFLDVEEQWKKMPGNETKTHQGWLITNTRFSEDALQYGNCVGLRLMSWDYPKIGSLKEKIDNSGLHPITCLTTLTRAEKQRLLSMDKVFSADLCKEPMLLNKLKISKARQKNIISEAQGLCSLNNI